MKHRAPQKSYTTSSLERWFGRLAEPWEQRFSKAELEWGRTFYREQEVRSTEVMDDSAVIHFKRGKEPLYAVIDWDAGGLALRSSDPAFGVGRGLGVAAVYVLEEVVMDELPPLPPPPRGAAVSAAADGEGLRGPAYGASASTPMSERIGRELGVRLYASEDGLRMEGRWLAPDGSVLGCGFPSRELSRWEREQLIGFTALAHRCGFGPGQREGCYQIKDADHVARFFADQLPLWRRKFRLEHDPALTAWQGGITVVRPRFELAESDAALRFTCSFTANGQRLGEALQERLFRVPMQDRFVPDGGIFRVDRGSVDSFLDWKATLGGRRTGEIPRYLLYSLLEEQPFELDIAAELLRWKAALQRSDGQTDLRLNDAVDALLRDYQRLGMKWLQRVEAAACHPLLADEMGLGKTLQVLGHLHSQGALGAVPVLVVCPASVVPVWQAELQRFFPATRVKVLSMSTPFVRDEPTFWLSSYTQLRRHRAQLDAIEFDYAVLDEAQSIKNPDAKVTHACWAIRAKHRIALSGTPMENRPLDLWTLFRFLLPGFLGSRKRFEEQWRKDAAFVAKLRTRIAPFILRRTKAQVARELPPKVEIPLICPLLPLQRQCYLHFSEAALRNDQPLGKLLQHERMHLFSLLTRLRQACCDPALLPGVTAPWAQSGKLVSLVKQLDNAVNNGSKVVIFSQFVQLIQRARRAVAEVFPELPQFALTGATKDRNKPVQAFTGSAGAAAFFVSLKAGGTGLNLQAADYVFLLDPWWNPAVEAQAIDRVHRLGQDKPVFIYRLITQGTIEDRIEQLKASKAGLFDAILSGMDAPVRIIERFADLESLIALQSSPAEPD